MDWPQAGRRAFLKGLSLAAVLALIGLPELPLLEYQLKYCLGKKPAGEVKLKLSSYLDLSKLPTPPEDFGHEALVPDWKMLANDTVGDCAFAGPFHALMLWNREAGKTINVTDECVLQAYSDYTGYDPKRTDKYGNNPTDDGAIVRDVAERWRTQGLKDADGIVHKISCYVALEPGNWDELCAAMYLFDGVGIGLNLPMEWEQAYHMGGIWDSLTSATEAGGHYVLGTGKRGGMLNVVTWGKNQLVTKAGYTQFSDEALIYLSEEKLVNGKDIDGFDLAQLQADLLELTNQPLEENPVEPSGDKTAQGSAA